MPISFDKAFSIHEDALLLRGRRSSILASNIANGDTPNYKARDIDFKSVLQGTQRTQLQMTKTSEMHRDGWSTNKLGAQVQYRVPTQPTLDGNTVETDVEQAAFAENAVMYRASLSFLNGQINGLRYAIRGSD